MSATVCSTKTFKTSRITSKARSGRFRSGERWGEKERGGERRREEERGEERGGEEEEEVWLGAGVSGPQVRLG